MGKEDEEPLGLNGVSAGQEGVAVAGAGAANAQGGLWGRFDGGAASVLLLLIKARVEKAVEPQSWARHLAGKWAGGRAWLGPAPHLQLLMYSISSTSPPSGPNSCSCLLLWK